ncbi:MAG: phosphate/phosphite/phosphonate ABC transporter substrate-binding protein [Planctomycetota bacterium]
MADTPESTDAPASDAPAASSRSADPARSPAALLGVIALILVVGIGGFLYSKSQLPQPDEERDKALLGFGDPVENTLNERYTDADGDLVADAPTSADAMLDPDVVYFSYLHGGVSNVDASVFQTVLLPALEQATGKRFAYLKDLDNEQAQLVALRDGELHVTAVNTGAVPLAVNEAGFVPLATPGDETGPNQYKSVIIAPAASGVSTLEDLRGKTLVVTRPNSNSGYKAPVLMLMDKNMSPVGQRDFEIVYSYGHEESIARVKSGNCDAAAVASDLLAAKVAAGEIAEADFRVVAESAPFPPITFGVSHRLNPEVTAKVTEALMGLSLGDGSPLSSQIAGGASGMTPVVYKDAFAAVRQIDNRFGQKHALPEADEAEPAAQGG